MSFEGYWQGLCESGHLLKYDIYSSDNIHCTYCGKPEVWRHLVDQTNDIGEEYPLTVIEPEVIDFCPLCKSKHIASPAVYEIPKKVG